METQPMTYLSDAGRVVLSNAAQRDDLSVLPLPETLRIKGGAVKNVLAGLSKRGLIREVQSEPQQFVITRDGMIRIGVEPDDASEAPEAAAAQAAQEAIAEAPGDSTTDTEAADVAPDAGTAAPKPTVRPGTKQALLIELLERPEGATADQIAQATGWQHHTIRGAISGALKKKLGLNVEATRTREVGPNKTGAKGSSTVYRIVG
jgi:hypothetical protein